MLCKETGRFPDEIMRGMTPRQINKLMAHYSLQYDEIKLARLEQENQSTMANNRRRWGSVR